MKKIILALSLLLSTVAVSAQIPLEISFETHSYYFENADFLKYNEDDYITNQYNENQNTDDTVKFIYSDISAHYKKQYLSSIFEIDISRSGYWGTDNLAGRDDGSNPFNFNLLNFIYYPAKGLSFQFGRFYYSIEDANNEYFFKDTIDGIKIEYDFDKVYYKNASIEFMADILGIASKPSDSYAWSAIDKDDEVVDNFQGDTISYRTGLNLKYEFIKVFSYYLRYAANTQGGADISENGKNDINYADNDFLWMSGSRLFYDRETYGIADISFVYSYGKDYQYSKDHIYNGYAVTMTYKFLMEYIDLNPVFFDGFEISGGYFSNDMCTMKATSPGGTLLMGYKGYFQSPYASAYHFKDNAKYETEVSDIDKTIPKVFSRAILFMEFFDIYSDLSLMPLWANHKEKIEYMGTEIEYNISYKKEAITLNLTAAAYIPSNYYEKYSQIYTYLPVGKDPFYGTGFSVEYTLDFNEEI